MRASLAGCLMPHPPSGGAGDPYWLNVIYLGHMDGVNGGTSFPDSSLSNRTVTIDDTGVTTQGANTAYGTGAAADFTGTGNLNVSNADTLLSFGALDFTVECWFYIAADGPDQYIFNANGAGAEGMRFALAHVPVSLDPYWRASASTVEGSNVDHTVGATGAYGFGQWHHFAFSRNGTRLRSFINGVLLGNTLINADTFNASAYFVIGRTNAGGQFPLTGLIDDFRVTRGVGRYTANFTPPTAPFPNF